MKGSTLFDNNAALSKFDDEATVENASGEKLTLKECVLPNGFAIGARHELLDPDGRVWRSELVLTSKDGTVGLRVKTQCIIASQGARAQMPQKPYFVKLALSDDWAEGDGEFAVIQEPHRLAPSDIALAANIATGATRAQLPIIYISRTDNNGTALDDAKIDSLAFRLGGVAHVVVEPSRAFSRLLIEPAAGRNAYGGAVGVSVSGYGVVRKYFLGGAITDAESLLQAVIVYVSQYVTNRRPRLGWEWQDLIDESSNQLRRKVSSGVETHEALFDLWAEESSEKDNKIKNLQEQLERLQSETLEIDASKSKFDFPQITQLLGRELYKGEFFDRVRSVIASGNFGEVAGLPRRTREIARLIVENTSASGGAAKLEARIKGAGRDSSHSSDRLMEILLELGFEKRVNGGHPVLIPDGFLGLEQQTFASSPSDYRAGRNSASRIIRDFGLDLLK